ncbi:conserved protein, unknown function [Plasmodium malariae]|uniref:Protein kish n=1 Tax=Plasmodium malariae TaxID=5858 RepID=A0A1C3KC81_PLAMA|nr:conserved protein, unknown function [Plasmodium malariae]SBT71131.1 conserved protein, unknown function [Plasmodium malariae]SBT88006.1 conserved protein, unknown function [Plasmodium malariae]
MSALFNLESMITVIILCICTCTYLKPRFPSIFDNKKNGFLGTLGKFAIIGDRLSIYVSIVCVILAFVNLFLR